MDIETLPYKNAEGDVLMVVEAPKGSLVKLKYEPGLGAFVFQRALPLGVAYPYDWGFVPNTRAQDGDPIDCMVLSDVSSSPGVVIPCRPIGIVRLVQKNPAQKKGAERQRNDRIIAVPKNDRRYNHIRDLERDVREELETFFVTVTLLTKKEVHIEGWRGTKAAAEAIERCAKAKRKQP